MKKTVLFSLLLTLSLAGCGNTQGDSNIANDTTNEVETVVTEEEVSNLNAEAESSLDTEEEITISESTTATLYITLGGDFVEYPVAYTGDLTPEVLVAEISSLTGWNLDLADEITSGKGGMTVAFADTSALVVGPPEEQKEEFFCFDTYQLAESILSSVMHTLQYNYVDVALGDPSSLDIYFCGADDAELYIPQIDVTVSMYEPYDGSLME